MCYLSHLYIYIIYYYVYNCKIVSYLFIFCPMEINNCIFIFINIFFFIIIISFFHLLYPRRCKQVIYVHDNTMSERSRRRRCRRAKIIDTQTLACFTRHRRRRNRKARHASHHICV